MENKYMVSLEFGLQGVARFPDKNDFDYWVNKVLQCRKENKFIVLANLPVQRSNNPNDPIPIKFDLAIDPNEIRTIGVTEFSLLAQPERKLVIVPTNQGPQ